MTGNNPLRARLSRHPLLVAVVYTGVGVLPLYLVSAQVLRLERELGLGVSRLGIATAVFFGAAALASNPAGRMVARTGPSAGLRLGSLVTVASTVLAAVATDWWMIPAATAVAGIGNGLIQVGANIAIFDGVAVGRQGLAFGAKQASVPLAAFAAGISLPLFGLVFGWRWTFLLAGLLALSLSLSAPRVPDRGVRPREKMGRPPRSLLILGIAGFLAAVAGNAVSLFIVPSAVEVGISEAAAGGVLAVGSVLVVAVRLGAGAVVDRRNSAGHLEMALLTALGAVGAFGLLLADRPGPYLLAVPAALLGAWGWPGVFFFTVVRSYPAFPAKASGLVLSSNLTGTMIGPFLVGLLAGQGNYRAAWGLVAVAAAVSATAFAIAYRVTRMIRVS